MLHELANPMYAWCRVTRVVLKPDFYYGFARDDRGRTLYFQKPNRGSRTTIWLGPWELKDHPPNRPPAQGHFLFGEWEPDLRKPGAFRLKWHVSALDLGRFRRCLEQRNMIFARRPSSAVGSAILKAVLYGDVDPALGELQRKQIAHVCDLPLDFFLQGKKQWEASSPAQPASSTAIP